MKKAGHVRALPLAVAEVDDMLASLVDARGIKDLNSQQRQQLEEAHQSLSHVRRAAIGQFVDVPVETMVEILRCVSMTQQWLRDMFNEYAVVKANE
jgi:hypothetical protein